MTNSENMGSQEQDQKVVPIRPGIEKLKIVYLYKDYGPDIVHPATGKPCQEDLQTALAYFRSSCSKTYPNCEFLVCSTEAKFEEFLRGRAQIYAQARREYRGPMMFLDIDVLAYYPLPKDFWEGNWDIALTRSTADWPLMQFNEGVIFANDTPGAMQFLNSYAEAANKVSKGLADFPGGWWITQLALTHAYEKLKHVVDIKVLDHEKFNFIPDKPIATNAYFIHFKGERKKLMRQYLAGLLGTDYVDLVK